MSNDIVHFISKYPACHEALKTYEFLESLLPDKEHASLQIIDQQSGEFLAFALLLDHVQNASKAAELCLLGLKQDVMQVEVLKQLMSKARLHNQQQHLEIGCDLFLPQLPNMLEELSFVHDYDTYEMEAPLLSIPSFHIPQDWKWIDYQDTFFPSYYETLCLAFADVKGTNILPAEQTKERLQTIAKRKAFLRLLINEHRQVAGFASGGEDQTASEEDKKIVGSIGTIGRHPLFKGQNLGPAMLLEAMRVLKERGYQQAKLQVTAKNKKALILYLRYKFVEKNIQKIYFK